MRNKPTEKELKARLLKLSGISAILTEGEVCLELSKDTVKVIGCEIKFEAVEYIYAYFTGSQPFSLRKMNAAFTTIGRAIRAVQSGDKVNLYVYDETKAEQENEIIQDFFVAIAPKD